LLFSILGAYPLWPFYSIFKAAFSLFDFSNMFYNIYTNVFYKQLQKFAIFYSASVRRRIVSEIVTGGQNNAQEWDGENSFTQIKLTSLAACAG